MHPYLSGRFRSLLFEVVEFHHLSHDEASLEVCVDFAGCLWCLSTFLEC